MEITIVIGLVLVLLVAAGVGAAAAGVQQRHAMHQLLDANRALMESERQRGTAELDGRGAVLDERVDAMREDLARVTGLLREFEEQRGAKLDVLKGALEQQHTGIAELARTTQGLREALSGTKTRGQWGERMAEDVLQLAGFIEGIQYRKQVSVTGGSGIPDFTFLLPRGSVMYMDVKFPLDNYLRYLNAESQLEQHQHRADFLRDVKAKVKELADRGYTRSDAETVDCVLLFIPNEQLYAFIQEHGGDILDEALRRQIVMCSPLTLFAVLAVVRQAVDNFRLERTAGEILDVLSAFEKQWGDFTDKMTALGARLESANKAYDDLSGPRRRMLERQLDRIEGLREQQALTGLDADEEPRALGA